MRLKPPRLSETDGGGWGNIILEAMAMDRQKALELYNQSI